MFYIFSSENFSYILGNGKPLKSPYISGNGNPKKLLIFQEVTLQALEGNKINSNKIFLFQEKELSNPMFKKLISQEGTIKSQA